MDGSVGKALERQSGYRRDERMAQHSRIRVLHAANGDSAGRRRAIFAGGLQGIVCHDSGVRWICPLGPAYRGTLCPPARRAPARREAPADRGRSALDAAFPLVGLQSSGLLLVSLVRATRRQRNGRSPNYRSPTSRLSPAAELPLDRERPGGAALLIAGLTFDGPGPVTVLCVL